MTTETITTNITTTRILDGSDQLYILRSGSVTTSSGSGVNISGSTNDVFVEGAVIGITAGVATVPTASGTDITVAETGVIMSGSDSTALNVGGDFESITNYGLIAGARGVYLSGDSNRLVNYGSIVGDGSEGILISFGFGGIHVVANYGDISGNIDGVRFLSTSNSRLDNFGTITGFGSGVNGFSGPDVVNNAGLIDGKVMLDDGNDTYNGAGGRVIGNILGGSGNDELTGGDERDKLKDGSGNDTVKAGAGDDLVTVGSGSDEFRGGAGNDTISYEDGNGDIRVDLLTNATSGGRASGDIIRGFENVIGGGGDDVLKGTNGDNILSGEGGRDRLTGRKGDDQLFGNGGKDFLAGNQGTDRLDGGAGADTFHFDKGGDEDTIADFENNTDTIEIDNFGLSKNQVLALAVEDDGDVFIDFGGGDMLIIENATIGQLGNDLDIV